MKTLSGMKNLTRADLPELQEEIARVIDEKLNGTDQSEAPFWRWQLIAVPQARPAKKEEFLVLLAGNQNKEGALNILQGGLEIFKHEKTKVTYAEESTVNGRDKRQGTASDNGRLEKAGGEEPGEE